MSSHNPNQKVVTIQAVRPEVHSAKLTGIRQDAVRVQASAPRTIGNPNSEIISNLLTQNGETTK